ncbi:MAG: sugar phosphate isomerase/epimerase family protein [Thermoguttaceae bacterium]
MNRWTRRQFCTTAMTAIGTAAIGPAAFATPTKKPFRWRYALASCMYGRMTLAEIVPQVHQIGAEWIDLWPSPHGNQREQMDALGTEAFGRLLDTHHVRLGMTTRYDLGPFRLQDELRLVAKLGGRLVVTGSAGPKDVAGAEAKAAVAQFVEQMKPHLDVAEECGVTIGIENHAHALIHTPDSLRYLAELSPSPRLGIALAPYHLPQDEKLLAALIADLGPRLVHFYAWQHGQGCMKKMPKADELEQMPGRGKLNFRPLVAALQSVDYQGWTEIFMHPTPRGSPILDTVADVTAEINRARTYLEDCLS